MSEVWAVAIFGGLMAFVVPAVGWLITRVIRDREDHVKLDASLTTRIAAIEKESGEIKGGALTSEGVREVVEKALSSRDSVAFERRKEWDERLALKIAGAVTDGFTRCQTETRAELERAVPRIVREVLANQPKPAQGK